MSGYKRDHVRTLHKRESIWHTWAAPAAAAHIRPTKLRVSSSLVENLEEERSFQHDDAEQKAQQTHRNRAVKDTGVTCFSLFAASATLTRSFSTSSSVSFSLREKSPAFFCD